MNRALADFSTPLAPPAPRRVLWRVLLLAGCAALLLIRLTHYPLWDDEACTAILARGVWMSGDTLAVQGDNVMAYGGGKMTFGLYDRVHPPLQMYVMAPFVGLLGSTTLAPRLAMALTGLAAVALLLHWLVRDRATPRQWAIFAVLLLTHVSLFLFLRTARYYALAIFFSTLSAYLYLHLPARPTVGQVLRLGLSLAVFPFITLQGFACLAPAFLADHLLFGRRHTRFGPAHWAALLLPVAASTALLLLTWNPFPASEGMPWSPEWWTRFAMVWWAFRDFNATQMGVGALLLAAPVVGIVCKRPLLIRGTVALAVFLLMDGLTNPQTPDIVDQAEVRHLTPAMFPALALAVGVLDAAWARSRTLGVTLLLLAGFTNVLHWGALQPLVRLRSVQYLWARELISPVPDSYSVALDWLRDLPPGTTVGVEPAYKRYPLMYYRPDLVFSWQLDPRHRTRLPPTIPPRQYRGVEPPAYFLAFGLWPDTELRAMQALAGPYTRTRTSDVFWRDMYRPELNFRVFTLEDQKFHRQSSYSDGLYLFRRPDPATTQRTPVKSPVASPLGAP